MAHRAQSHGGGQSRLPTAQTIFSTSHKSIIPPLIIEGQEPEHAKANKNEEGPGNKASAEEEGRKERAPSAGKDLGLRKHIEAGGGGGSS